jgi:hypothetical protein
MKWFEKNYIYVVLALFIMTGFKSCQSCSRQMMNKKIEKTCKHEQDSLKNRIDVLEDSLKNLNYRLNLAKEQTGAADKRAASIQSVAEKIKSNSTTVVKIENGTKDKEK